MFPLNVWTLIRVQLCCSVFVASCPHSAGHPAYAAGAGWCGHGAAGLCPPAAQGWDVQHNLIVWLKMIVVFVTGYTFLIHICSLWTCGEVCSMSGPLIGWLLRPRSSQSEQWWADNERSGLKFSQIAGCSKGILSTYQLGLSLLSAGYELKGWDVSRR